MNKREQFLLHLYDQLWNSITRVEQGLWQFIGIYAGILVIHWTIGKTQPTLAAYLTILVSFWGINIAINAGKWFERNRMMIINVEKQFLSKDDLGKIIPASYHKRSPRKLLTLLDRTHIAVFTFAIFLSMWTYWHDLWKTRITVAITVVLLGSGLILTVRHWYIAWKEIKDFVEETRKVEEE